MTASSTPRRQVSDVVAEKIERLIVDGVLKVGQPLPSERPAWRAACAAAMTFWARVGEDERISSAFRALAHARRQPLLTLAASLAD